MGGRQSIVIDVDVLFAARADRMYFRRFEANGWVGAMHVSRQFSGRIAAAAGLGLALLAVPATADQVDWAGPHVDLIGGYGWGTGDYHFNTNGWFNTAPGEEFSVRVVGAPMGVAMGWNWQNGQVVYGFDATFLTAFGGISSYHYVSPYYPASDDFDLKGHWFGSLTARVGFAYGPMLFSVNAGPAVAHLVTYANDSVTPVTVHERGPVPGFAVGATADWAITPRVAIGVGYEYMTFMPLSVVSSGIGATDHTIRFSTHMVTARVSLLTGGPDGGDSMGSPSFDWAGPYAGITASTFHELGAQAGYNFVFGNSFVVGTAAQAATVICVGVGSCGPLQFETDVSARVGYLVTPNILVYGTASVGYMTGSHFGLIGGGLYSVGGGLEIALTDRTSGFMEIRGIGELGSPLFDANFRGGINIHLNGMFR